MLKTLKHTNTEKHYNRKTKNMKNTHKHKKHGKQEKRQCRKKIKINKAAGPLTKSATSEAAA